MWLVVVEPDDDCRGRRKLPLNSLCVVGSFYRDAYTTGVASAFYGVGLLNGDDCSRRNSTPGRRIALMATTTYGAALRMRVYGWRLRTHREPPPPSKPFTLRSTW